MRFNSAMLLLARESRTLTQKALAQKAGIYQGKISRFENGLAEPSEEELHTIAVALTKPESFFFRSAAPIGLSTSQIYYRRLKSLNASTIKKIEAEVNIYAMEVATLLRSIELPELRIPTYDIDDFEGDADGIARRVRTAMQLPSGPVRNLVAAVESAGGIVILFPFATRKIDAIGQRWPETPPLFFVNPDIPTDRMRFTLAHEIGHIVMHRYPSADPEREAHRFASEFLMPGVEIKHQLAKPSIQSLAALKPYWRTSIQSLARRAFDLGHMTEWQYKRACMKFNALGYPHREPVELTGEYPTVLADLIEVHQGHLGYTDSDMATALDLTEAEFVAKYLPDKTHPMQMKLAGEYEAEKG